MNGPPTESLASEVVDALRAALPSTDPSRASIAGRGWDVIAWRVPSPDGDWLVRVPRVEETRATVEAQHRLAEALAGSGVPLPREHRLLRSADGAVIAGVYRYVDAREAHVRGSAQRQRLAISIAETLSTLHALDPATGVRCGAVPYEPWRDWFGPMIERCAPYLGSASLAWMRAVGARLAEASMSMPPLVIVHADLKPAHVLVDDEQRIVALLDFEGARVSDPALEFSRLMQNWDPAFASMVLREYRGAVDKGFMARAQCYWDFDPLEGLDIALRREWPEWLARSRRALSARAGAATRRG